MSLRLETTQSDSHDADEKSCNAEEFIKRRISAVTQKRVGQVSGMSVTTVNRIYNGERGIYLSELKHLLAVLDLAIIQADEGETRTISNKEYQALRRLLHLYSEPES